MMKKAFLLLAAALFMALVLAGCEQSGDDAPPTPETAPETTLLISNQSDYDCLAAEYAGVAFGDINSGKGVEKKVSEGVNNIFFYLQTTNGKIRCRIEPFNAEKEVKKTITNYTMVNTTVSDRQGTLQNIVQTLNAEPANPEIEVSYDNRLLSSGDTVDLGEVPLRASRKINLVISNKGEHDLKLTGNAPQITGDNAAQVSAGNYAATKIEHDAVSPFTITFTPTTDGVNRFTVTIINNDQDEGEYTVTFTARKNTWQKLYGSAGKRYGIFRAISNGENGVYAGGYTDTSSAAFFNFDQYGNLKKTFSAEANEHTLGPVDMGYVANNFYSIIEYGNGYRIYQSASASAALSFVTTQNMMEDNNPVYLNPAGIVKNTSNGYLYAGGNARWTSGGVDTLGISVFQHSPGGALSRSSLLSPSVDGVNAGTYLISGIALLNNGDVLLYGCAARSSGVNVAFACAVRTDQADFSIRWQHIYPVSDESKASLFTNCFWDGNDLILLGYGDEGSFAAKFSGSPTNDDIPAEWPKVADGCWSSGQRVNDGSGYIFVGETTGANGAARGGTDIWLVKTDPNLVKQWDYSYGGAGDDHADAIIEVSDGFIIAGSTTSPNIGGINKTGDEDIYLLKVNKDGTLD
jgi:hypothetical protein